MTKLTRADLNTFLRQTPVAVVHLDAEWDGYRFAVAEQIAQIESQFAGVASFGYMDVDEEQEYAREIDLRNTPACAYFKDGRLMAVLIGVGQDIAANIQIIQGGGLPHTVDGLQQSGVPTANSSYPTRARVSLPLVHCHQAAVLTPDQVSEVLTQQEVPKAP